MSFYSDMSIQTLYLLLIHISLTLAGNINSNPSPCGSFLMITCPDEPLSRMITNKIRCTFVQQNCKNPNSNLQFIISLSNKTDTTPLKIMHSMSHVYEIKTYTVGTGKHSLKCSTENARNNDNTNYRLQVQCPFEIKKEIPTAIIAGGHERYVNAGEAFELDGTLSMNNDDRTNNLVFEWYCVTEGGDEKICEQEMYGKEDYAKITLPAKAAINNAQYVFELQVTMDESGDTELQRSNSFHQTIYVRQKPPITKIECLKNCPPAIEKTDTRERTVLQFQCEKNCGAIKKGSIDWKLMKDDKIVELDRKQHQINDDQQIFTIEPGVLEIGQTYTISTTIIDSADGGSKISLNIANNPKIENCKVEPASGTAMNTDFLVKCEKDIPGDITYKIYSVVNDNSVLLTTGPLLDNLSFKLPENAKVKLEVETNDEFKSDKLLDVRVEMAHKELNDEPDKIKLKEKIVKLQDEMYEKIVKLMDDGNYTAVLPLLNAQSEDINNFAASHAGFDDIKLMVHGSILDIIKQFPIKSSDDVKQITQLVVSIIDKYDKADPDIVQKSTEICKDLSSLYYEVLSEEDHKGLSSTDDNLGCLGNCLTAPLDENKDLIEDLEEEPLILDITTTQFPVLPIKNNFEQYEDYKDDEKISEVLKKMNDAIGNMREICYSNEKIIDKFVMNGEGIIRKEEENLMITFYKDANEFFRGKTIEAGHVVIQTSDDENDLESNHVVVCTTEKNGFWWLSTMILETALAIVRFNDEESEFDDPFTISFPIINKEELNFDFPEGEFVYNGMTTYRIDVFGSYHIFFNITDEEQYTVLLTKMRKPTLERLRRKGIKVSSKNPTIFTSYTEKFHSWHFLNILKEETKENPRFTVTTYGCFKWDQDSHTWQFSCVSSEISTDDLIVCECRSASILKGQRHGNTVRLEVFHSHDFEMVLEPEYVIAVATITIFFIFITLYILVMRKNRKNILDHYIIFLADTPHINKFAYLVVVKTERGLKHGTTSNISMRLIGEKYSSLEHVLNYPDPERMLLQKGNEDWFIMAEEKHLGKINMIEIWFDSVGIAPNWKCRSIEVYDLQSKDHWYFSVMKLFSLHHMKDSKLVVELETKNAKKTNNFNQNHHFWAFSTKTFGGFPAIFRLITVYSIILSILLLCLICYGLPNMEESDSLTLDTEYTVDYRTFFIGMGTSLLSSLIHCPLTILFRSTTKFNLNSRTPRRKIQRFCWIFLTINIVITNFMLLIFGLWTSQVTSLMILSAALIGIVFYALVLEFLIKLISKPILNVEFKASQVRNVQTAVLQFVESQRIFIYRHFGHSGLRPYLGHFYEPLTEEDLERRQEQATAQINALQLLEDLIMYAIYMLLLYLVFFANRENTFVFNNMQIRRTMETEDFEKIFSLIDFNQFIQEEIIEDIQASTWYPYYTSFDAGLMSDKHNSYFGVARLRQSRSVEEACSRLSYNVCRFEFCDKPERRNFSKQWKIEDINTFDRLYQVWVYVDKRDTGANTYTGKVCSYDGGGYVAPLGRTYKNSHINFKYLRRNNWIDFSTRFVSIEFLSYNVHTNLFSAVEYVYEFSVTGAVFSELEVETARLLPREDALYRIFIPVMAAFLVIISFLFVRLIYWTYEKRRILFKIFHVWLLMDFLVIVLSLICLLLFCVRASLVKDFVKEHEVKNLNEFVPYMHLFFEQWIYTTFTALLIGIATIRLWKFLRFLKWFQILERTLVLALSPVINLLVCHFFILLAYAYTGFLLFGTIKSDFKNIGNTLMTLHLCAIQANSEFDFSILENPFHYFYYITFMLISMLICTMYITIVIICYQEACVEFSNKENYSVIEFVWERILFLYELIRVRYFKLRKRGGQDDLDHPSSVYPKEDEHRYADCITISSHKMQVMTLIAQSILMGRNLKTIFSKKRFRCVTKLLYLMHIQPKKSEECFYLDNLDPKNVKLVDDRRMLEMEGIARKLLDPKRGSDYNKKQQKKYKKCLDYHHKQLAYFEKYLEGMSKLIGNIEANL